MKKLATLLLTLSAGSVFLTGCYTQLYTGGYVDRAADYRRPSDSALAKARESDTLAPADSGRDSLDRKTVIVNNYYEEAPVYRGYSTWDWDYPIVSFGFYSSRYRDYYHPYWWNQPYYGGYGGRHGHHYDRYDHYDHSSSYPGGGGSYQGEHHIFSPAPAYPEPRRGRRSEESQASPAPKTSAAPETRDDPPRRSSDSDNSNKSDNDHPSVHKGKRR